jgi:hypothetical protein
MEEEKSKPLTPEEFFVYRGSKSKPQLRRSFPFMIIEFFDYGLKPYFGESQSTS